MAVRITTYLLISITALAVVGCGGKPFTYYPISEMKPGPGVFTDEVDGYTLYDSSKAVSSNDIENNEDDYREYQEYQKWRRERGNATELEDFKEWQKYRRWKEKQQQ